MNTEIDYTRIYCKWHSYDPEHIKMMKDFYCRTIGSFLPGKKDIKILDIGCGMGFAMMFLKDIGYHNVSGIDIDENQVRLCKNKGLDSEVVSNTDLFLRRNTGFYDLILALDLVEHIACKNQLDLMKALYNSLKPGGKFICTVPNANSALASRWRYNCWTHRLSFTENSLDFLLHNAGFNEIEITGTEAMPVPGHQWLIRKSVIRWWLLKFFRGIHRLEYMAELGIDEAKKIPLTLNLIAVGVKKL